MSHEMTRRQVLGAAAAGSLTLGISGAAKAEAEKDWAFLLLGDLHYDRLEHHDMDWLKREKPNDIRQVENYSRITRDVLPGLFQELKGQIESDKRIGFVSHIGDLVEGLAGTPELARTHCRDAVAFVRDAKLGKPFVFVKGNHDVTGPGAVEAFNEILLPFAAGELKRKLPESNFVDRRGDALFVYFDAYRSDSLDWLEKTMATRTAKDKQFFFIIHPPVVPYGARSNWHVFAKPEQEPQRARLLSLLGKHRALVLCGHLHKYGTVVRQTPEGPFAQIAVVSVLSSPNAKAKDVVSGVKEYGPDLVRLEPSFSPDNIEERRNYLKAEAPHIRYYDYADVPGYSIVRVSGAGVVTVDMYEGLGKRLWKSIPLSEIVRNA